MTNNKIAELRKSKNLTLQKLANLTDLSIGYLCHLEKGSRSNPSMKTMKKICIALDESIENVFPL